MVFDGNMHIFMHFRNFHRDVAEVSPDVNQEMTTGDGFPVERYANSLSKL